MTSCISLPDVARSVRPSADMTPVVTVFEYPSGLPMAIATWPTRTRDESPNSAYGSADGDPIRSTARSESGSLPTTSALKRVSSFKRTVMRSAPCTT